VAIAALLAAVIPVLAVAQEKPSAAAAGRIDGTVTDLKGKTLPGATVTLSSDASDLRRTGTTDKKGNYRFEGVPAGQYTVTAELPEFVTAARTAFVTADKPRTEVKFFLSVASTTATKPETPKPIITPFGR